MKKIITIAILAILSLTMTGCYNLEYSAYTEITNYDIFENYFIGRNQSISIDYDVLEELYDYDTIKYSVSNEDVVKVNYMGNVKGKEPGVSLVKATLYDGRLAVANVAIGYFINIDMESDRMIPIENYIEFKTLLKANTYGSLYLNDDIEFPVGYDFTMISEFKGMLINPYGYTVSGVQGTSAIFGTLENAYIDGLIIEDSTFTGEECGALAINAEFSYVTNTHVFNSTIDSTGISGGLIANSIDSTYNQISFEGDITTLAYAGGLFGTVNNGEEDFSHYKDNFLLNSYVYANITAQGQNAYASGLVGYVLNNAKIENGYFLGSLTSDTIYLFSKNVDDELVYYINLYTSLSLAGMTPDNYAIYKVYRVTEEALRTGTQLPGLEAFTFEIGDTPKN